MADTSYKPAVYKQQGGNKLVVATGGTVDIESGGLFKIGGVTVTATAAEINAALIAGITVTGPELNAMQAEVLARLTTPMVIRTNHLAATVTGASGIAVPAVAGKRFQVMHIAMRANGGNVSGPTTVGVKEDGGAIFLSHVIADLTATVWHNLVTGTPVVTGMTSGGMTAVANKGLLVYCAGGDATYATSTSLDVIVVGYYTTT